MLIIFTIYRHIARGTWICNGLFNVCWDMFVWFKFWLVFWTFNWTGCRAVTWEAQGFSLVSIVVLLDELANFVNKFAQFFRREDEGMIGEKIKYLFLISGSASVIRQTFQNSWCERSFVFEDNKFLFQNYFFVVFVLALFNI